MPGLLLFHLFFHHSPSFCLFFSCKVELFLSVWLFHHLPFPPLDTDTRQTLYSLPCVGHALGDTVPLCPISSSHQSIKTASRRDFRPKSRHMLQYSPFYFPLYFPLNSSYLSISVLKDTFPRPSHCSFFLVHTKLSLLHTCIPQCCGRPVQCVCPDRLISLAEVTAATW